MCDEYIKREDAIKALTADALERNLDSVMTDTASRYHRAAQRVVSVVPAADVRPVIHAQWVRLEDADDGYCSNCKCDMPMCREDWEWKYCETDYCPNCGADMRTSEEPESLTYIPPEERSGVDNG